VSACPAPVIQHKGWCHMRGVCACYACYGKEEGGALGLSSKCFSCAPASLLFCLGALGVGTGAAECLLRHRSHCACGARSQAVNTGRRRAAARAPEPGRYDDPLWGGGQCACPAADCLRAAQSNTDSRRRGVRSPYSRVATCFPPAIQRPTAFTPCVSTRCSSAATHALRTQAAAFQGQAAEAQVLNTLRTRCSSVFQLRQAFLLAVRTQDNVRMAREHVALTTDTERLITTRVTTGDGPEWDLITVQASKVHVQRDLAAARQASQQAVSDVLSFIGASSVAVQGSTPAVHAPQTPALLADAPIAVIEALRLESLPVRCAGSATSSCTERSLRWRVC